MPTFMPACCPPKEELIDGYKSSPKCQVEFKVRLELLMGIGLLEVFFNISMILENVLKNENYSKDSLCNEVFFFF